MIDLHYQSLGGSFEAVSGKHKQSMGGDFLLVLQNKIKQSMGGDFTCISGTTKQAAGGSVYCYRVLKDNTCD